MLNQILDALVLFGTSPKMQGVRDAVAAAIATEGTTKERAIAICEAAGLQPTTPRLQAVMQCLEGAGQEAIAEFVLGGQGDD